MPGSNFNDIYSENTVYIDCIIPKSMHYTWNNPVFIADTNSLRLRNYLHSIKLVLTYLEIILFIWWVPSQVWKN